MLFGITIGNHPEGVLALMNVHNKRIYCLLVKLKKHIDEKHGKWFGSLGLTSNSALWYPFAMFKDSLRLGFAEGANGEKAIFELDGVFMYLHV